MSIRSVTFFVLLVACLAGAPGALAAPSYQLIDLGIISGGGSSQGNDINQYGHAAVTGFPAAGALWNGVALAAACALQEANGINTSDLLAGEILVKKGKNSFFHAAICSGTTQKDLGVLGGSESQAEAVNDAGQVIGNSDTAVLA